MENLLEEIESRQINKGVVLWWLGGSSYVLKTPQSLIYVDLFTGPAPSDTLTKLTKDIPDLIDPAEIKKADLVLSTHEHIDHCHQESLLPIYESTKAIFVGAPSSVKHFKAWGFDEQRIIELRPQQSFHLLDVNILAQPNKDCADKDAVSYLFQVGNICLFEGGDSLYFDEFKAIGKKWDIDIALLNYFTDPPDVEFVQTMVPSEVAQAAQDLGASILIPKHWDIWKELKANPADVAMELDGSSVTPLILKQGEEFEYQK